MIVKSNITAYSNSDFTSQNRKFASAANIPYTVFLFLIWPVLGLTSAIRNFSNKRTRFIILWFFILFGATGVISENTHDALSHTKEFQDMATKPFSEISRIVTDVFTGSTTSETDIYASIVSFVVSRFTDNPAFMFAFHAFVFGFFYLKSISLVFDEFFGVKNRNTLFFLILFISVIPIDKVQYVRFWTAAWVFIYAMLLLLKQKRIKYFILMLLSVLVHASFVLPVIIAIIYFLAGNRTNIYFIILAMSYIVPTLLSDQIEQLGSLGAGELIDHKVSAYALNDDYIVQRSARFDTRSWYVRYQYPVFQYSLLFVLTVLYVTRKKYMKDAYQVSLFSFMVLFLSFVNFGNQIASIGERFLLLFFCFSLVYLYRHFSLNPGKKIHWATYVMFIPSLLWIAMQFRGMLDFMNAFMLLGNPFFFLFEGSNVTLLDL